MSQEPRAEEHVGARAGGRRRWDEGGPGGERCGRGWGRPRTRTPAPTRSHPRPAPLESNRHSPAPVKPMTALVSHKLPQTQEYQNVSLFDNQIVPNTPSRLRSSSAANSTSVPWAQAWFPQTCLRAPPRPAPPHTRTPRFQAGLGPTPRLPRCPSQSLDGRRG